MRIILASGSPRRKELMKKICSEFEITTAPIDERSIEQRLESGSDLRGAELAEVLVKKLSEAKASAVFDQLGSPGDTLVIGADTAVALSDCILGKPKNREEAVDMLRKQSLEPQKVITGVTFISEKGVRSFAEISTVIFHALDAAQEARIQSYCDTDEPYDKAGGYGIQALGDRLVERFEGDFNNIVGFPVSRIKEELDEYLHR